MVDIHSHILPALDDGPETMEQAIEMAKLAAADGAHTMIATPHTGNGRYNTEPDYIREAVMLFNQTLQEQAIPLTVCCGQEIRAGRSTLEDMMKQRILPLNNSRYYLLELPFRFQLRFVEELIHEFLIRGAVPIIAHPERNFTLTDKPEWLYQLITAGALSQVNADSLLGANGRRVSKSAETFIAKGWVHFIASDSHNIHSRKPCLYEAYEKLKAKVGHEQVHRFMHNSQLVIRDRNIASPEPLPAKRRWFVLGR